MSFQIKVFKEEDIAPYLEALTKIRVDAFFDFPYLYVPIPEEERLYANELITTPQTLVVGLFYEDQMVGFFSGIPLKSQLSFLAPHLEKLQAQGIALDKTYYGREIIITPPFQKQHGSSLLIDQFCQEVIQMGFERLFFITSLREKDHPLRPTDYVSTDPLWPKIGAEKLDLEFSIPWNTRQPNGPPQQQMNPVACWIKSLKRL